MVAKCEASGHTTATVSEQRQILIFKMDFSRLSASCQAGLPTSGNPTQTLPCRNTLRLLFQVTLESVRLMINNPGGDSQLFCSPPR